MQVHGQDSISRNSKIDSTLISQDAQGLIEKANAGPYTSLGIQFIEPPVQAAFIIAVTTLITVILGFIFKDSVIRGWIKKRTTKRESQCLNKQVGCYSLVAVPNEWFFVTANKFPSFAYYILFSFHFI